MSREAVAQRIAAKVYFDELACARALAYHNLDAYVSAFRAMDATYLRAFAPDRPAVWPRGGEPRTSAVSSQERNTP